MNQVIEQYLEFLKFCLDTDRVIPSCVSQINWHDLLVFAQKQAVVGVYWHGMQKLTDIQSNKPTDDDVLEWMAKIVSIQRKNEQVYQKSKEISDKFRADGFDNCILKGQGNALLYPDPYSRTAGDIDILLSGSRHEILSYVQQTFPKTYLRYQHIEYPIYNKVPVEVHFIPIYLNNPVSNHRFQKWVDEHKAEQMGHWVEEPGTDIKFTAPTLAFNRIYQMIHILHHFYDEGVGLRQIADYYYVLKNSNAEDRVQLDMRIFSRLHITRFVGAVMWVLNHILGLEDKYLLCRPNEKYGRILLQEILDGGNFGHFYSNGLTKQRTSKKYFMGSAGFSVN